jgi:acetylornithine deacetylase/succinyl-diaminopimelate desuccinylase-like protein
MSREQLLETLNSYFDSGGFRDDLARRVACRTESDTGQPGPALDAYLRDEIAPRLSRLGFDCEVAPNPDAAGGPLLVARRIEGTSLPTVLTYGHGDVVSGQEGRWREGLAPWQLTVEGARWYGRGTADNKGQHTINLSALEHAIAARNGKLGYNMTVLLETGEEAGSPGLQAFCESRRDMLDAQLLLACDGPRVSASRPTLFLGSRGGVNFSLTVQSRDRAFHSGNWGGVLANPAVVLANALATMVDARGRMRVRGLLPPPIPGAVRDALTGIEVGGTGDDPAIDEQWGEPGLSPIEKLVGWNTLEILAMEAGSPARPVNAIPPRAVAHCQLRFVVGTRWQELEAIVRAHLDAAGFPMVQVAVTMAMPATRLDLENPWVDWALGSMRRSCGRDVTLLPNLAGSLPNDIFSDLLGMPTLWVPHSYPACGQHAPNEHLLADVAREGLQLMGGLYWDLGEPGAPWQ